MSQPPVRYSDTLIFPASLDPEAVMVVRRLNEAGLESYFVGGCVRDLLLGRLPKDFDISTEARPRQIRRLFRNSRIIGRRFKLAHIHFGGKIIEVATFRRTPEGTGEGAAGPAEPGDERALAEDFEPPDASSEPGVDPGAELREGDDGPDAGEPAAAPFGPCAPGKDLLITRDNEFGTAEEDAVRRDFTINALLYDVRSGEVIDYVGGVPDLQARRLRTIGDPYVRFAEDPVRMLRAVKFCSRLDLELEPTVEAALRASAERIGQSAPPRVLEEIYKLLTCGRAERALPRLMDYGLFDQLLPEIAPWWRERGEQLRITGRALDLIDGGRRRRSNAFLLAALWLAPWRHRLEQTPGRDPLALAAELVDSAARRMSIPRRDVAILRQQLLTQLRFERPRRSRRFRLSDFLTRPSSAESVDLLHLAALSDLVDAELHAHWVHRLVTLLPDGSSPGDDEAPTAAEGAADDRPAGSRRRRRGGRRRRGRDRGRQSGEDGEPASLSEGDDARDGLEASARRGEGEPTGDPRGTARVDMAPADGEEPSAGDVRQAPLPEDDRGPRRRRSRRGGRRHRRRGGERPAGGPPLDADATSSGAPAGASSAGAPTEGPPAAPGAAAPEPRRGGPDHGQERRGRRGRRGGRRRGERHGEKQPAAARPDSGGGAPAARPERASPGRRSRRREPSPDPKPRDDGPGVKGPGQRHPEDVEDFFDW